MIDEDFKVGDIVVERGLDPSFHNLWGVRSVDPEWPNRMVLRHVIRPPWCNWEADKTNVGQADVLSVEGVLVLARIEHRPECTIL